MSIGGYDAASHPINSNYLIKRAHINNHTHTHAQSKVRARANVLTVSEGKARRKVITYIMLMFYKTSFIKDY